MWEPNRPPLQVAHCLLRSGKAATLFLARSLVVLSGRSRPRSAFLQQEAAGAIEEHLSSCLERLVEYTVATTRAKHLEVRPTVSRRRPQRSVRWLTVHLPVRPSATAPALADRPARLGSRQRPRVIVLLAPRDHRE